MKIGIIGFGDMGKSIATGLMKQGVKKDEIEVYDKSDRAQARAQSMGMATVDFDSMARECDAVLLTIPAKGFYSMDDHWHKLNTKLILSCMAEVPMAQLKERFGGQVVRVIPTLAAENGISIVGVCFDGQPGNKDKIKDMFSKVGTVIECTEDELAPLTSLAACGLCYAAYILNSFINTAENLGFDREQGKYIVERTFRAAMEQGDYEYVLGRIAGRGGITIKGVNVMNENNVHKSIDKAFKTAYGELLKSK